MIKVFNGGYEVAKEYYFTYENDGTEVYDNGTRIISGLLHVRGLTELEQLDFVNHTDQANLVILESMQVGYMVNLLNVRNIEFTTTMSNTESVYRITGAKKMKPRKAESYKVTALASETGNYFSDFEVKVLTSFTLDKIVRAGYFRTEDGTDIRYFWVGDEPFPDLQHEVGKCRLQTGESFYVTQTGGTNIKMQMPSKSGVPFPNGHVKFVAQSGTAPALVQGQRLEVN